VLETSCRANDSRGGGGGYRISSRLLRSSRSAVIRAQQTPRANKQSDTDELKRAAGRGRYTNLFPKKIFSRFCSASSWACVCVLVYTSDPASGAKKKKRKRKNKKKSFCIVRVCLFCFRTHRQ